MVVVNNLLWFVASLGVAVSVLFQLLPWSLGLIERVDVLLSRTLFWYFTMRSFTSGYCQPIWCGM